MLGHPKLLLSKGSSLIIAWIQVSELEAALFPETIFECYPDPLAEWSNWNRIILFQISWCNHQLFSYFLKKETHVVYIYIYLHLAQLNLIVNAGKYP